MTKRSPAMRTSRFLGHAAMGRTSPARGSMDDLSLVDVRLHALEMRPAAAIPPAILAAVDDARRMRAVHGHENGRYLPPMRDEGVEALRAIIMDRWVQDLHLSVPHHPVCAVR